MSDGLLRATSHCVVSPSMANNIHRSSFATFMQPDMHAFIDPRFVGPLQQNDYDQYDGRYKYPMTFGEFSKNTFAKYY